jgi:predicted nucleotidyltransferase
MNKYIKFEKENEDLIRSVAHLLGLRGIEVERDHIDGKPMVSGASISGEDGIYFRVNQMGNFNSKEVEDIKRALNIRIDGYEVKLLDIGDFEMDDDRYWHPTIAFTFMKDNQNVLN